MSIGPNLSGKPYLPPHHQGEGKSDYRTWCEKAVTASAEYTARLMAMAEKNHG